MTWTVDTITATIMAQIMPMCMAPTAIMTTTTATIMPSTRP